MTEPLQDERRWKLIGDEIRPAKLTGPGYGPPQRMTAVDGPALGILERVEVVPSSSLDQALAERDRAREALFECAKQAGADVSDGAPTEPPIEEWAVQKVRELRRDYDENEDFKAERDRWAEVAEELAEALRPFTKWIPEEDERRVNAALAHYEALRDG